VDIWLSASVGCAAYLCFTLLCLNRLKSKQKGWQVLLAVLLGFLALPIIGLVYSKGMVSIPPDDIFRLVGIIAGFASYHIRERWLRGRLG
jgi:cadmium resistance protein CadD (predicted permease)